MYCCITRPLIVHLRPFHTFVIMCPHFCSLVVYVYASFSVIIISVGHIRNLSTSEVRPRSVTLSQANRTYSTLTRQLEAFIMEVSILSKDEN